MKIYLICFLCFLSMLCLGCGQYASERLALAIGRDYKPRLSPVGTVKHFEVKVKVRSDKGVETKVELVEARVVRYIGSGAELAEGYDLKYKNGGSLSFVNSKGDRLVVRNQVPTAYFTYGSFNRADIFYANGTRLYGLSSSDLRENVPGSISSGALWRKDALASYGFRMLDYRVEELPPKK